MQLLLRKGVLPRTLDVLAALGDSVSLQLLLAGVFAFFGIHTAFWLYREVREKLLAVAGSAAAISTIFGNPLVAVVLMLEVVGLATGSGPSDR